MLEKRFLPVQYRADAGRVAGVVMRYGSVANIGGQFKERFSPGAFGAAVAELDVICRLQHERSRPIGRTQGGGLTLTDSPTELRADLVLPSTADGRDAQELLGLRILRGFSVEFRAKQERIEASTRIVETAQMTGLGLVDEPAYGDSLAEIAKRCRGAEHRGQALAALMQAAIPEGERTEIVERLASAAGISTSTVNQILRGDIDAPPLRRLRGFSRVLGIPVNRLVAAAKQDGGQYPAERSTKPSEATLWL